MLNTIGGVLVSSIDVDLDVAALEPGWGGALLSYGTALVFGGWGLGLTMELHVAFVLTAIPMLVHLCVAFKQRYCCNVTAEALSTNEHLAKIRMELRYTTLLAVWAFLAVLGQGACIVQSSASCQLEIGQCYCVESHDIVVKKSVCLPQGCTTCITLSATATVAMRHQKRDGLSCALLS